MIEEHSRTAALIGEDGVKKLQNSRVILFGLGGVGSYTAEALVRAGIGAITLVDGDTVALSNINRQLYALHSTVGMAKTDVAKQRIADIAPDCQTDTVTEFVTEENIDIFFSGHYDFCIDAIDDTRAKTAIALKCKKENIPLIASMGTGCKTSSYNFRITDIYKTEYCPLCKVMRKKYKAAGLTSVTVLFSPDMPDNTYRKEDAGGKRPPSSISFIPSSAGLKIAEYVVGSLL